MKSINWEKIQKYYDDNHTWREIKNAFGVSMSTLIKARNRGMFISRNRSDAGILSNKRFPRKLSEETKKKISSSMIEFLKDHPDRVPYLLNHYSKGESYPEKYFNCVFTGNSLTFERYLQYNVYNLDFAFVDKLINVEIDGDQHICDKAVIRSNQRRDKYLTEHGWKTIRILWSEYQKLTPDTKKEYINALISIINNFDIKNKNIQIITLPSGLRKIKKLYHCSCGNEMHRKSKMCIRCAIKLRSPLNGLKTDQIINDVKELGYVGTGKKYGVSDNAVRKRIKKKGACLQN